MSTYLSVHLKLILPERLEVRGCGRSGEKLFGLHEEEEVIKEETDQVTVASDLKEGGGREGRKK